jgi:signal transduction histidine kinase
MYTMVSPERDAERYGLTLIMDGATLLADRQYNKAFEMYFKGLKFAEKHLTVCELSKFNSHLGKVKFSQEQYAASIPYLKKAFQQIADCQDADNYENQVLLPQSILNTIALAFERHGKLDSAVHYYQAALDFVHAKEAEFPKHFVALEAAQGVILGNLGGTLARLGDNQQAEKHLKRSIEINNRPGYEMGDAVTAENKLIALLLEENRLPEAYEVLKQCKIDLDRLRTNRNSDMKHWLRWHELYWKYLDKKGQTPQAYAAARVYYNMRDSLDQLNNGLRNADLEAAFQINQQRENLNLLQRDNEINKVTLRATIALTIMAAGVIILIIINLRRSRRQVAELTRLNTQVNQQNERLQQTLADLEQSQRENKRLLQVVAHDLRNPIGAITALTDIMLRSRHKDDEKELLTLMQKSGKSALALVNDLLVSNSNKKELEKEMVELLPLLNYCIDLLQIRAAKKEQRIELIAVPLTIPANREKLWRVLSNLIDNAIKFSPPKTVITVKLEEHQDQVRITVADQGIGIPLEHQQKLFDMPAETRRTGTEGEATFGLGLAIARQIIEAHNGRISLESKPGEGTSFYVELPLS